MCYLHALSVGFAVFDFELKRFFRFASPIFVLAVVWIDG
jgi:hypothetical protein